MTALVWNILLALAWTMMTGAFTFENLTLGMVIGFIAFSATRRMPGVPSYSRRSLRALGLAGYLGRELVLANVRVAIDVVRPHGALTPAVLDVPLDARTDAEITLLAALITLTPGSTAIGISRDRRTMFVHMTNLGRADAELARQQVKQGFERRVLEVMR